MNKYAAERKTKTHEIKTAFGKYGILGRMEKIIILFPLSLSVSHYTEDRTRSRNNTQIVNLKRIRVIENKMLIRIGIIPQHLVQFSHTALTAVDTVHIGRSTD
jgi:hypothetical protein